MVFSDRPAKVVAFRIWVGGANLGSIDCNHSDAVAPSIVSVDLSPPRLAKLELVTIM